MLKIILIIALIVFVIIPIILFSVMGILFAMTLKKNDMDKFKGPKIDLSFYENSPHKKAVQIGKDYMSTCKSQKVSIMSYDGFKLNGTYFPAPESKHDKVVIGMHGFKSVGRLEYAPYIEFYHSLGFDMLMPDQRAHGDSEGTYCTMGVHERFDCVAWANFVVEQCGNNVKILLHGVSMGAATVCSASCEAIPKQVIGIISDCAYANTKDVIKFQLRKHIKIPSFPLMNIAELYCKHFAKFDFHSLTPEQQVKKAKVPILFVHGDKDCIVPLKSIRKLYNACSSEKRILIVKNANHAESIAVDPKAYHEIIIDFFNLYK